LPASGKNYNMDKAARIISILFHPLIMPSVGFLLLFNSGTYLAYLPFEYKKMILLIVFLCTFIIPLSILPFFLYHKIISDINMSGARERFAPLVISFILFVLCYFLLRKVPIPPDYLAFCIGCAASSFLSLLIISKWKISLHMIGIGGLTGLIIYLIIKMQVDLSFYLILTIIAAGLTGTARLFLNAHRPFEIYAGFLAGLLIIASAMFIF
jgi:hypothetical protein